MLSASCGGGSGGNIVGVLDIGADPVNDEGESAFEKEDDDALTDNEADADCDDL